MATRDQLRREIQSLQKRSNVQLNRRLVAEGQRIAKHYVGAIYATRGDGRDVRRKPRDLTFRIDNSMLTNLRRACRRDEVPDPDDLLETIWDELRVKICDEYDLCSKFKRGEVLLDIIQIAVAGLPAPLYKIVASAVILGFRRGPKWMCNCY